MSQRETITRYIPKKNQFFSLHKSLLNFNTNIHVTYIMFFVEVIHSKKFFIEIMSKRKLTKFDGRKKNTPSGKRFL